MPVGLGGTFLNTGTGAEGGTKIDVRKAHVNPLSESNAGWFHFLFQEEGCCLLSSSLG